MGILGLTHDENGSALEKLPVTIKVAIGEGPAPDDENGSPRALFHFVFKRRTMPGQTVCWEPAPDIAQVFGDKPTELAVIFLHDDPREVCPSEYALWTRKGRLCHGELVQISNGNMPRYEMQAIRRTTEHPEGEAWPGNQKYAVGPKEGQPIEGCGEGCPELESGKCGPSADLYFILEKFPSLGAICRLHTGSKTSVPNLSNAVAQLHSWNGGRLKWVKATLKVKPELRWHPGQFGEWESSVVPILSLEIGGTTLKSLGTDTAEPAKRLIEVQRGCAGAQRVPFVVRESELERAPEIADEFYPQNKNLLGEQTGAIIRSPGNPELCTRICEVARMLGYNAAKTKMLVGQWRLDLVGLERKLQHELDEGPQIPAPGNRGKHSGRLN
jgi:recombination directionality factor gp3-like protein